jgi:hypothetical protein
MTLQVPHSEFPDKREKVNFLFYLCTKAKIYHHSDNSVLFMAGLSLHMVDNSCSVYGVKLLNSAKESQFAAFANSSIF